MDHRGKIVSTKRDDLNKILDHMNIQVDNPMNVLTQDNARSFIASTDEKVKYQVCYLPPKSLLTGSGSCVALSLISCVTATTRQTSDSRSPKASCKLAATTCQLSKPK